MAPWVGNSLCRMQICRRRSHFQCSTNRRTYRLFGNHCWLRSIWTNFLFACPLHVPQYGEWKMKDKQKGKHLKGKYLSPEAWLQCNIVYFWDGKTSNWKAEEKIIRFTDYVIKEPSMASFIHLFLLALCQYKSKCCNGLWFLIEIGGNSCTDEKCGWKHHKPVAFNKRFV